MYVSYVQFFLSMLVMFLLGGIATFSFFAIVWGRSPNQPPLYDCVEVGYFDASDSHKFKKYRYPENGTKPLPTPPWSHTTLAQAIRDARYQYHTRFIPKDYPKPGALQEENDGTRI